jgi:ketosteroid isomerase-like protein
MSDMLSFADEFFAAIAAGDIDAVSACYRDDVRIWHNYDDLEQGKAENLEILGGILDRWESFAYTEPRTVELEDGYLRQHVIVASKEGRSARVPAMLRVFVEDRRIHRIEEYFDRGQLYAPFS